MARSIVTGLDIGTTWVRLVVAEQEKNNKFPTILAVVRKESRGLRRGYVVNVEETAETIREALTDAERATKTKIRSVFVGVGGVTLEWKSAEAGTTVARADGTVTELEVRAAIDASEKRLTDIANKKIIHTIPLHYKLDGKKILGRPEGMKGTKLEVHTNFILCLTQHLQDLIAAVELAGLTVEDIVAAPLAAALVTLTKMQKMAGCILVNIGSQTTSVVVFEENAPLSLHVFPIGSADITNDIALGLKLPLEDAERIKLGQSEPAGARKKLDEIIDARLSDIFEIIENHLKKIGRSELLPAGVIVTGGGAGISNIEELAKKHLKLPARISAANLMASSRNQIKDPAWAVAYGLAVYGADAEPNGGFGLSLLGPTRAKFFRWLREFLP